LTKNAGKYSYVISTTFFNENHTLKKHIKLTRKNGTFTMVALGDKNNNNAVEMFDIVFNQIKFEGSLIGSYNEIVEMLEFSKKHECYPICE
jgi:D-arabinose 1-dehydrogenase-like Zn-dependent alcohol dehydrogenase